MALLKCKMCGGDLEIIEGSTVCICEYCGTKQTVPTLDNEKKIALFTRANRLRLGSEFDKAYSIYESILIDYPEEAEAYWGLVLCKYGIEYVDDPKTATKVPTCHRSSFESIFDDSNFELAIEYADATARAVYREEAKAIEEIRKGIIEISSHEEPYDIFICYKETDEGGSRTIDSVIAQDVYDALVSKGYRVFFARITLEDKLGKEYEPYIFSALHSSKVMLVFGTDYEYFNAVWVKNEWSRFLKLIETDKEKALIPCYKDIDAYDMPKEFRKLQAQDMGKVGAIQDLIRGIGKILSNKKQAVNKEVENTASTPTADVFAPFLKKAKQQLKNGKFEEAKISYQKVLEFAPTLEEALVGSFLSAQRVSSLEKLEAETSFFNTSNEYLLLCESASDELNSKLSEALEKIKQNNISALDGAMHSKRFDDARAYIENLKSYDSDSVNEEELYFLIDVKASSFEELENGTVAFYDNKIYKSAAGDFKARLDDALSKIEGNIKKAKLESVLSENNVTRVCDLPDSYLVKNCKRLDWIYEIISEEEGQALRERILSLTTNNRKKKPLAIIAVLIVVALAVIIAIVVGVSAILISRLNNNGDTSTDTENTDTGSTETDSTDTDSSGNEGGENEGGNDSSDSNTGNEGDNAGNEGAGDNNTGVGGEGTGNEDSTTLVIPDGTVAIKSGEYANNTTITKVVIPSSVKTIDASAFSGCTNLKSVTIPNSVTEIGEYAFRDCTSLTKIEIPSSVVSVGYCAFKDCTGVTSIEIKNSETSIEVYAFKGCTNVEIAIVPTTAIKEIPKDILKLVEINGGTSIEDEAFKDCQGLLSVEICDGVTTIGASAFNGCTRLANVKISNTVSAIGASAFSGCNDIATAIIPANAIVYIPKESLNTVKINGGTSIVHNAFTNCKTLTTVEIPNSVTSISTDGFKGCTGLTSITVVDDNPNYYSIDGVLYQNSNTYKILLKYPANKINTDFIVPDGITSIREYAFEGTKNLKSITLSSTVFGIGLDHPFEGCDSIENIIVDSNNKHYSTIDGNLYSKDGKTLIRYAVGKTDKSFVVPESVGYIQWGAVSYASNLESIEITGDTGLDYLAFANCTNLKNVTIISTASINSSAFDGCDKIENVIAPSHALESISSKLLKTVVITHGTSIVANKFKDCSLLTSVEMPNTITSIGDSAFYGCTSLTSLEISSALTTIGDSAFYGCSKLENIDVPSGVTKIGASAFYGCSNLTSIVVPEGVTTIADNTFNGCTGFTSIVISRNVTSVGKSAFEGCENIETATLPAIALYEVPYYFALKTITINGGTTIEEYSFECYPNLTNVIVLEGITTIEQNAFSECENLKNVIIPNTVTSIADSAFYGSNNIENATMPTKAIEYISKGSLKTVVINGGTSIPENAFGGCITLNSIEIQNTVSEICKSAFGGCTSLESVDFPDSMLVIGETAFTNCTNLKSIVIPDSVTSIGNTAFAGCSILTNVELPNTLEEISYSLFVDCYSLESVVIPNSVTTIGPGAFVGCRNLASVEMSNSVTTIGPSAFANCEKLTNIVIPNGVTSIEGGTFNGCRSLSSIVIPNSVVSIEDLAFANCTSLKSIVIPSSVSSMSSFAFEGSTTNIENATIPTSLVAYIPKASLKTVTITTGTIAGLTDRAISSRAFENCTNLVNVTIQEGIDYIGDSAFKGCTSLKKVEIPNTVISIGTGAFDGCNNIEIATMPTKAIEYIPKYSLKTVTINGGNSIGSAAFAGCTSLTSIEIPNSVTCIGDSAFSWCTSLASIEIPNSVTIIDSWTFEFCSGLKSITIPDSVTSIGEKAFLDNNSLTSIYYKGSIETWAEITIDSNNLDLTSATCYYYSENQPTDAGDYWHYDSNGKIVVW